METLTYENAKFSIRSYTSGRIASIKKGWTEKFGKKTLSLPNKQLILVKKLIFPTTTKKRWRKNNSGKQIWFIDIILWNFHIHIIADVILDKLIKLQIYPKIKRNTNEFHSNYSMNRIRHSMGSLWNIKNRNAKQSGNQFSADETIIC